MKRSALVVLAGMAVVAVCPHAGRAAAPGSAEAVVEKALDALNHGRLDTFVKAMHPNALSEFRATILETLEAAAKRGKQAQLLEAFEGVSGAEELKALDAPRMFAALLGKVTSAPDAKKALAATRIEVLGHIFEGKDRAYVVYRSRMRLGERDINRLNAASLLKSGQDWKLSLFGDVSGQIALMTLGLTGEPALPDIAATRVEPVGHIFEGKRTALVVYRTITPIGDSSLTRLGVLGVNANDPAWEAVRKDDTTAVVGLIEKNMGIRKVPTPESAPAPTPAVAPEVLAARKAAAEAFLAEARARAAAATPRKAMDRPVRNPFQEATPSALPDGLTPLPASFFGGDRDRFHDLAPEGGVLVGARVSYILRFGGPKISSVQPVYRVGEKLVDGKRYGGLIGKETKAIAKPGYAVGAVKTHTGLTVDGFELVFMRIDGDRLDTSESYTSAWLGDRKGGSPRDVSSDGKIPVGLQGRAGKEVNALGLIVKTEP